MIPHPRAAPHPYCRDHRYGWYGYCGWLRDAILKWTFYFDTLLAFPLL